MKRTRPVLLDSYALLVYFKRQKGGEAVLSLLIRAAKENNPPMLSIINWGEILYITEREEGAARAKLAEEAVADLKIKILNIDAGIVRQAAHYKARGKISYADAICAATAKAQGAMLVTGDPEFKVLESELKILWI